MMPMTKALTDMAIAVPAGPATGRKVVPGMTNAPHPMMQLSDSANTSKREGYFAMPVFCRSIFEFRLCRMKDYACLTPITM